MLRLSIQWKGPYKLTEVVEQFTDAGEAPGYEGEDYGLYQIYGRHILGDRDALLYVGETTEQTFSCRFRQHQSWLIEEWDPVRIHLGRIYSPRRHTRANDWATWKDDVMLAERIMIYKYSPHYNSSSISEFPLLPLLKRVELIHKGKRNRLHKRDIAPDHLL